MEQQDRVSPISYPGAYLPQEDDGVHLSIGNI